MITNNFTERHIGPRASERKQLLDKVGVSSLDELIKQTIPMAILKKDALKIAEGMNEFEYLNHLKKLGNRNKQFRTYIGMGYYGSILPGVIQRNILENPGWYTSYTPYQAEISQGRLQALLNFQTMITDLTAMEIANASLLDEGTAAAEAMIMAFNARARAKVKINANKFFVSDLVFSQTKEVIITRAEPLGIELVFGDHEKAEFDDSFFGAIVQYPDEKGSVNNYGSFVKKAHENDVLVAVAADILSLCLLTPPGEWDADIVVGSTQRFGIPMGYGGPHAAYFATREKHKRNVPGRIIGISKDARGNDALRMALQTREQHIKRERATSNICTAQVLLAVMAGMYAIYHGPKGLFNIARHINILTNVLSNELLKLGYKQLNKSFFDTLHIELPSGIKLHEIQKAALGKEINLRYIDESHIGISLDEITALTDVNDILEIFTKAASKAFTPFVCDPAECEKLESVPEELKRSSHYLEHEVFNTYHSETEMMRYMKNLEIKDLALNRSMIPLGSCTMKLNAGAELFSLSWPEFGNIHPFVPQNQAEGYNELIRDLEKDLCEITGYDALSFQPNSGAAGEYTGLMVIREYLRNIGEGHRNIALIPCSAHGTNPASAIMAGMNVVVVDCDSHGNVDMSDLKRKATEHKENLAALMVTYPSTHGVFEQEILEIIKIIHDNGGQVYMDGANMNAMVGLSNPDIVGADVCHLNLHKTFAIPHGGGGPGVGPIGVKKHLTPFLPKHGIVKTGGEKGINPVAAAPYGSAMILPLSYAYIKMMGGAALTDASKMAILNANYLKDSLKNHYKILYTGKNNRVAHEFIIDCNEFNKTANISVIDIAKRLMDYGFHAPTVAFPVPGTLMVEPTESEPLHELNRFIDAMIAIREELKAIENGEADKENNLVKNAPHTAKMVIIDDWEMPYSRKEAAFPKPWSLTDKYWPTVTKIDDAFGDRNLVCTCQAVESYRD